MEDNFTSLYKKIEEYEQNRIKILKNAIIVGSPAMIIYLSFGIYIAYFGKYITGGILMAVMLLMFLVYTREIVEYKRRREIHKLFSLEIYNKDTIDTILVKISSLTHTLEKSIQQRKSLQISKAYYKNLLQYLLIILIDLRSDLTIHLKKQEQDLKSAKVDVERYIQGSTELNKVSELQKIRLDKQIEQFEELQRVLVKV